MLISSSCVSHQKKDLCTSLIPNFNVKITVGFVRLKKRLEHLFYKALSDTRRKNVPL